MNDPTDSYAGRFKYTEKNALKYRNHKPAKQAAEMKMLETVFALVPAGSRVLDAPCGTGRATILLAESGFRMSSADLAEPMLKLTQESVKEKGFEIPVEKQDLEKLSYPDQAFDAVLCFRLFHHFPNREIRRRVVGELCRVAKRHVALSYFSPWSPTSLKRIVLARWKGGAPDKFPTPLSEVKGYFAERGFTLRKDVARLNFLHTMHLALFERNG